MVVDIYISYEDKEIFLVKALKEFIQENINNLNIEYRNEKKYIENSNYKIMLVLCSPYSINGNWIHYETGYLSLLNGKADTVHSTRIIPIMHSGLTTAELPQYLVSMQGLTMPNFYNSDIKRCSRNYKKLNSRGKSQWGLLKSFAKEKHQFNSFGETLIKDIRNYLGVNSVANISSFSEVWSKAYKEKDETDVSSNDNTKLDKEFDIKVANITQLLKGKGLPNDTTFTVSISNQYFYKDSEKNYYVGLCIKKDKTHFDCAPERKKTTLTIEENNELLINKNFKRGYLTTEKIDEHFQSYLEERLKGFGTKLFFVKFDNRGSAYPAILFLNDSDSNPRIDIGLVQLIDDNKENQLEKHHWIWCKDGMIIYHWFENTDLLPTRFKYCSDENALLNKFISSKGLAKAIGNDNSITAYAPDEEIGEGNVVNYVFTTAARQLLTCF